MLCCNSIYRNMMNGTLYLLFLVIVGSFAEVTAESCPGIFKKAHCLPKTKACVSPCGPRTLFLPRQQGSNAARHIVGWKEWIQGCDDRAWGNFSVAFEYSHSMKSDRISQYLFGANCLKFTGSEVADRAETDLMADYFGLPTNFEGKVCFKPVIENMILDINYMLGLDNWCYGLYCKVNFPIVTTRWDLGVRCNEMNNISSDETPTFQPCYMAPTPIPPALTTKAATSIKEALSGNLEFGNMEQPLMFGMFPCGRKRKSGVANIDLILGYNYILREDAHHGIYVLTLIPTGNRPNAQTVFEPIIGNGNLWEIGPGVSGHFDIFRRGFHQLSFYYEGVLTHQFRRIQVRSFDLNGHGPLSRYMLLKEFDDNNLYDGMLINAIDFSSRAVRAGNSVRFDAAIKASYFYDRYSLDVGYNIYARTREKLHLIDDLFPSEFNNRKLGIKGTEGVCYRVFDESTGQFVLDSDGRPVEAPLNSTQNRATINQGGPVDNPEPIVLDEPNFVALTWDNKVAYNSNPPVLLKIDDLNCSSGATPHQLTHKFFAHLTYTALDRCWEPQIGVGGEIEFDGRSKIFSALNQWGIWLKFAFSF